jgi:hypothetical protein
MYAQIYFYDGGYETQMKKQLQFIRNKKTNINILDEKVMGIIQKSMECNLYTKIFKTAGRRVSKRRPINLNIGIINHRHKNSRPAPV